MRKLKPIEEIQKSLPHSTRPASHLVRAGRHIARSHGPFPNRVRRWNQIPQNPALLPPLERSHRTAPAQPGKTRPARNPPGAPGSCPSREEEIHSSFQIKSSKVFLNNFEILNMSKLFDWGLNYLYIIQ